MSAVFILPYSQCQNGGVSDNNKRHDRYLLCLIAEERSIAPP